MPQNAGYPVVRKFTIDTDGTSDVYVDIGKCLSMINHRLYRQGRNYRCRVSITSPTQASSVAVTTLPDTWWARRAYNKVRDIWMMRVEAMKEAGAAVGRWNDFKVGYDNTHHDNFSSTKDAEMVTDATGTQAAFALGNGEWNLSELLDNDGNDNTFRMLGTTSSTEFAIIDSYSHVTNVFAPDPDETGTGSNAYSDLMLGEAGDDTDMDDQGDYPPYNEVDFPQLEVLQSQLVVLAGAAEVAGIQRLSSGYFDAPLGLLRLAAPTNNEITIEVMAGDYKGVAAPQWE